MAGHGCHQTQTEQGQSQQIFLAEEDISLEDLLASVDGDCQQHQQTRDQQQQQQQQQQQVQDLCSFTEGADDRSLQQLLQLQSESNALLNSFASELLSHTDFHVPNPAEGVAKIEDITEEEEGFQFDPALLQLQSHQTINLSYLQDQPPYGLPPPEPGQTSFAQFPSPSGASSASAWSSSGVSSAGTSFGSSDVDSPQITEDFDEMALIPETLKREQGVNGEIMVAVKSSPPPPPSAVKPKTLLAAMYENSGDATPVCPVCGNKAGKHSYYGGQVCNSCRAFFRRSVQNNTYPKFACKKESSCDINSRSWKSCQYCRFQKCQSAGMKASWVLTEPERKARAKQRADTKKKRQEQQYQQQQVAVTSSTPSPLPSPSVSASLVRQPEELFTEDDRSHILGLIDTTHDYLFLELCKFYTRHVGAFDEFLNSLYKGGRISQRSLQLQEDFLTYSVKNFYRGMGDMMNLSGRDQNLLVTKNYPLITEFAQSIFLDTAVDMQLFVDGFALKLKGSSEMGILEEKFNHFSLSNSQKVKAISYEQIHEKDWIKDKEASERYKELCLKVQEWPRDRKDEAGEGVIVTTSSRSGREVDEIQYMLMALIMLFSTDFIELDDPSRVSSVQTKYGSLLYRYLKSKYRAGSESCRERATRAALAKFCQGMFVSSMSREMREIKEIHCKNS